MLEYGPIITLFVYTMPNGHRFPDDLIGQELFLQIDIGYDSEKKIYSTL